MKHKLTHKDEVKGGKDSHMDKKMHHEGKEKKMAAKAKKAKGKKK